VQVKNDVKISRTQTESVLSTGNCSGDASTVRPIKEERERAKIPQDASTHLSLFAAIFNGKAQAQRATNILTCDLSRH